MRRPSSRLALPALFALLTGCPPSDEGTDAGATSASSAGISATSTSASSGTLGATASTDAATSATATTTTLTTTTSGQTTTDATLTSGPSTSSGSSGDTTTGDTGATTDTTTAGDTTGTSGTSGTSGGGEPMPFDCFGCVCDAADHFCVELQPGVLPPLLPDEACPDSTLFEGGCVPFPDECAQDPSCACLGNLPGACSCQKGESPVLVTCPLP